MAFMGKPSPQVKWMNWTQVLALPLTSPWNKRIGIYAQVSTKDQSRKVQTRFDKEKSSKRRTKPPLLIRQIPCWPKP